MPDHSAVDATIEKMSMAMPDLEEVLFSSILAGAPVFSSMGLIQGY